jgi:hypothetical protein
MRHGCQFSGTVGCVVRLLQALSNALGPGTDVMIFEIFSQKNVGFDSKQR